MTIDYEKVPYLCFQTVVVDTFYFLLSFKLNSNFRTGVVGLRHTWQNGNGKCWMGSAPYANIQNGCGWECNILRYCALLFRTMAYRDTSVTGIESSSSTDVTFSITDASSSKPPTEAIWTAAMMTKFQNEVTWLYHITSSVHRKVRRVIVKWLGSWVLRETMALDWPGRRKLIRFETISPRLAFNTVRFLCSLARFYRR